MNLIIVLLILHFISDFLFQPRIMGENKSKNLFWLLLHCLIIFIAYGLGLAPLIGLKNALAMAGLYTLIHGIQDKIIWNIYAAGWLFTFMKRNRRFGGAKLLETQITEHQYWKDYWFYTTIGIDQLLHCITLVYLYGRFI